MITCICRHKSTHIHSLLRRMLAALLMVFLSGVVPLEAFAAVPKMNVSTGPAAFEIPIRNVRILTITYPGTEGPNEAVTLFDAMVR